MREINNKNCKSMIGGYELESMFYILNSENCENLYMVGIGTGTAWMCEFIVNADHETIACDMVADFLENNELIGLYSEYYDIMDICDNEKEETVDEYIENNNLTCCGNHGIYIELLSIHEL